MELIDLILGNFDKDSKEARFSKILAESYKDKFNIDEFDTTFNDVAGYKPVKTAISKIAMNAIDSYDLNDSDRAYAIRKFSEAYEDVADKSDINVQAIVDGIIDEIDFTASDDEDVNDSDVFEDDDIDSDDDDDFVEELD
jgi:hypothetical protein